MSVKSYCLRRLEQLTTYTLTQREVRLVINIIKQTNLYSVKNSKETLDNHDVGVMHVTSSLLILLDKKLNTGTDLQMSIFLLAFY